jgi:uncharacterized protein YndB with AHSA1/START domain
MHMIEAESGVIQLFEYLPQPPAKVWKVLTDPALMERWLMPNDFRLERGHQFRFLGSPIAEVRFGGVVYCEVLDFEVERMLSYAWRDPGVENGLDSVVTWWLDPVEGGTRLVLEHRGFDPDNRVQQLSHRFMSGGWVGVMRRLIEISGQEHS